MCSWMGIQDASKKVQEPLQETGTWEGTVTHTTEGVYGLVSQDIWDKDRQMKIDSVEMEDMEK